VPRGANNGLVRDGRSAGTPWYAARSRVSAASAVGVLGLCAAMGLAQPDLAHPSAQQRAEPTIVGPMPDDADQRRLGVATREESTQPLGPETGPSPGSLAGSALRTAGALALVVALMVGLSCLLRRAARTGGGVMTTLGPGGRAPSGVLSVLGRFPVGHGQQLVLLKVDRRVLLLAQQVGGRRRAGGPGFSTLCEFSDPEEVASLLIKTQDEQQRSIAARFHDVLARHDGRFAQQGDDPGAAPEPIELDTGVADEGPVGSLRRRLTELRSGEDSAPSRPLGRLEVSA